MHVDDSARTPPEGTSTDPLDRRQQSVLMLQRALMLFRGHSPFALLDEIYLMAVEQAGFTGSLEEAAELVAEVPEVRVEIAPDLGQSRVYASAYWSPTS